MPARHEHHLAAIPNVSITDLLIDYRARDRHAIGIGYCVGVSDIVGTPSR